jgi:hypothetical protein
VKRQGGEGPVTILGNDLTDATDVSFNGTAATFTIVSGSEIKTTVPTGCDYRKRCLPADTLCCGN